MKCIFCHSENIKAYKNPIYIRNTHLCIYCYTLVNDSGNLNIENKFSREYIKNIIDYSGKEIKQLDAKNIFIFNKLLCIDDNADHTPNYHLIKDYNSIDLSQYLRYGKFDILIIPDGNIINIDHFLSQINIYLNNESKIIIGFFRERHYLNNLYNYNYIYNCYSIDRIAEKYNLYVQKNFIYEDDYYIISLGKNEPTEQEISILEKLTNEHIIEDYNQI